MNISGIEINSTHISIAKELINILETTESKTITYSELSNKLGGYPYQRNFKKYLIDLSSICIKNDLPLISAIVIRKGKNVAGDGFVKAFFDYLTNEEDIKLKSEEELNKVKKCNDWSKLKQLLNI